MTEITRDEELVKQTRPKRTRARKEAMAELNPLQLHDLSLLERVLAVRASYKEQPTKDDQLFRAINRAVYAAYLDCIDEGIGERAKELLRREQQTSSESQ